MEYLPPIMNLAAGVLLAPLVPGVINRVKAQFAGRTGPPVLQAYYDLAKLLAKGAVYSTVTTWVFRAGPVVGLAAVLAGLTVLPLGGTPAILQFPGDFLFLVFLLGLMRFLTVTAALDTGSAFEGMGASREVQYGMLAEPALLVSLAVVARVTQELSLSDMLFRLAANTPHPWGGPVVLLVAAAVLVVALCENARVPFDDPATHLDLTMVHEVMVLDHGGVDLAFITYAAALKSWIFGVLLAGLLLPPPPPEGAWWQGTLTAVAAVLLFAILVGVIESVMARLRLLRVPQLLTGAAALAIIAFLTLLR
ncbi:MAG: NADH-quinone oxidoreductase subunit H [Planctomycetota bacterium]